MSKNVEMLSTAAYCLCHPMRARIIKLLRESRKGLSISEIVNELGSDRSVIVFHFSELEKYGLINGEYECYYYDEENKKKGGRAKRCFKATEKVDQVIAEIQNYFKTI